LEEVDSLDIPEMNSVEGMVVACDQTPGNASSICMSCKKLQRERDIWRREKAGPVEQTPQQKKGAR
jgi:hypothetical protein